jgi:hypothetical protein
VASHDGHLEVVRALIDSGASVYATTVRLRCLLCAKVFTVHAVMHVEAEQLGFQVGPVIPMCAVTGSLKTARPPCSLLPKRDIWTCFGCCWSAEAPYGSPRWVRHVNTVTNKLCAHPHRLQQRPPELHALTALQHLRCVPTPCSCL